MMRVVRSFDYSIFRGRKANWKAAMLETLCPVMGCEIVPHSYREQRRRYFDSQAPKEEKKILRVVQALENG